MRAHGLIVGQGAIQHRCEIVLFRRICRLEGDIGHLAETPVFLSGRESDELVVTGGTPAWMC